MENSNETIRLVAQCLNQLRHQQRAPLSHSYIAQCLNQLRHQQRAPLSNSYKWLFCLGVNYTVYFRIYRLVFLFHFAIQ